MPSQSLFFVRQVKGQKHELRRQKFLENFAHFSTSDANQIFLDAQRLNMTGEGYVWIVTEQALLARSVPSGTLGLQLVGAKDELSHISDSL